MTVLNDFNQWTSFLKDRLNQAESMGMNEQTIQNVAHQIGDYLAESVDPKNKEQRLLADLWNVGTEQEQQALANMIVKFVKKH
ncbi:MAG: YMFJ protein [Candidatus Carbobacillus altaicus]|uniref:YMFJ protein n=1 Tax=Candidatus Carbonibacillus altaicus TaxID=2163959 RepID=A0A2R6XZQ4_9BACL|nr:MAG: YMFJ protein [Candidatus Carbobacillus altaicus]